MQTAKDLVNTQLLERRKESIGTCVDNPFSSVEKLTDIIERGKEISKKHFLDSCNVPDEIQADMLRFPRDYRYYKSGNVMFYEWSAIEHFFR